VHVAMLFEFFDYNYGAPLTGEATQNQTVLALFFLSSNVALDITH
jgi:hypothetical protein